MGKRVLVVDDSATVRGYYASVLGQAGFHVEHAGNGYEALEKAAREEYDLFIVDVNMPKMPGYEFVRHLREDERTAGTPVAIISTEARDNDRLEGYRAGANVYLVKPVKPERLKILAKMLTGVRQSLAEHGERITKALDRTGFLALALAGEGARQAAGELAARCQDLADLVAGCGLTAWGEVVEKLQLLLARVRDGYIGPSERLAGAVARAFELLLDAAERQSPDLAFPERDELLAELAALLKEASPPSAAPDRPEGWPCLYEVSLELPRTTTEPNLFSVLEVLASAGEVVDCDVERDGASAYLRLRFRVLSALSSQDLEDKLRAVVGAPPGLRLSAYPVFAETCADGREPVPGSEEARPGAEAPPPASAPALPSLDGEEKEVLGLILAQQKEFLAQAASAGDDPRLYCSTVSVLRRLAAYLGRQDLKRRAEGLGDGGETLSYLREIEALLADFEAMAGAGGRPEPQPAARGAGAGSGGQGDFAPAGTPSGRTLRIDEAKVDRLMGLAGELVVACNALPYVARRLEVEYAVPQAARELREHHASLERLVRELQDAVMGMRLLPASFVFQKFPRMVRDLARDLGKKVELRLEGEETEIDKTVMQAIGEPLVHLVRNAVDHGLETPEERLKVGKPAVGRVTLRAAREGSKVVLEVEDDGKGIDVALVRRKAVAAGLVSEEEAAAMAEEQVMEFLFLPGFSTADKVTSVSGRGVGLDAVRAAVQRLGGSVRVRSELGAGTTIRLELPLTVATSRVLVVKQNGVRYGLPLQDVREMVKLPASDLRSMRGKKVAVLRGEVVPLVFLGEFLGAGLDAASLSDELCLVVLAAGYALVVDGFVGQEDIVLKPLDQAAGFDPCFAGAAVLGDGGVLLVLDPYRIYA